MHSNIVLALLATTFLFASSSGSVLGRFRRQAIPASEESNSTSVEALPQDQQMPQNVTNNSTMDNSTMNSDSDSRDVIKGDKIVLQQPTILMMNQPLIMVDGADDSDNSTSSSSTMPMDNDDNDDDDTEEGEDHHMHQHGEDHDNSEWDEPSDMSVSPSVESENQTESAVVNRYRREADDIIIFPGANSTIDDQSNCDNSTMNGTDIEDNDEAEHSADPMTPVAEDSDADEMDEAHHSTTENSHNENDAEEEENEHDENDQHENEDHEEGSSTTIWSSSSKFSSSTATSTTSW